MDFHPSLYLTTGLTRRNCDILDMYFSIRLGHGPMYYLECDAVRLRLEIALTGIFVI